jgi:hypothetical protein
LISSSFPIKGIWLSRRSISFEDLWAFFNNQRSGPREFDRNSAIQYFLSIELSLGGLCVLHTMINNCSSCQRSTKVILVNFTKVKSALFVKHFLNKAWTTNNSALVISGWSPITLSFLPSSLAYLWIGCRSPSNLLF